MDFFELLKQDHQKVSGIFEQIEAAGNATRMRQQLFTQLKQELDLHANIEESILYPMLKQAAETRDITTEAYEEHQEVKDLLAELEGTPIEDDEWESLLAELKDNVEHHVDEEENEMFTKAREVLSDDQISDISERMQAAKQQAPKSASAS
ncbi:MAG TPA: hemerythrin domain-containing protein [Pyrinomonadaceae bacterium]|jgi:iron-sulfur cluster repair protein YtfE (RIC family)